MNKISKLLAPCVSVLCLIHCLGMALISVLAPTLLVFEHSEMVEISVVAINLVFGNWSLFNMNKGKKSYLVLNGIIAVSACSLIFHLEALLHLSIFAMAAIQIKNLVDHRKSKKVTCCDHQH